MSLKIAQDPLIGLSVRALTLCAIALFGPGCTRTVTIASTFPSPLIEPLPLQVGVYYNEALREYAHKEERSGAPTYVIQLGAAQVQLFNQLFEGLFEEAVLVGAIQASSSKVQAIDAIVEPKIEEYAFVTPRDNGWDYYEVSIRYQVSLYSPDGELLTSWPVTGYGRSRSKTFRVSRSVDQATVSAMRDAAALMALEFKNTAAVRSLLCATSDDDETFYADQAC